MTPSAGVLMLGHGHKSHVVKMHHFFKNHHLNSLGVIQTNFVNSNDDQGSL